MIQQLAATRQLCMLLPGTLSAAAHVDPVDYSAAIAAAPAATASAAACGRKCGRSASEAGVETHRTRVRVHG